MSAEMIYCDDCGESIAPGEVHAIASLPVPVASANAGESAQLCPTCAARVRFLEAVGTGAPMSADLCVCGACDWTCWGDGCEHHVEACPECGTRRNACVGTGAPRNTGTLGAPALERVCTGAITDGRLVHDGGTCFLHEGHLHDGENEAPAEWCVFVLTNAPASYDYGYTVDTGRIEVRHRATCRLVMLSERHLRPQINRYLSGAYMVEVW